MPGLDGNLIQNLPIGFSSLVDMASPAARLPMDLPSMTGAIDGQLSFPDIFRQLGAMSPDVSMEKFDEILKNASNVDFSTPEMNKASGKQPDFFINAAGKFTKNPNANSKPGDPLNIEIQSNGGELINQAQGSAIQSIIDLFLAKHPGLASFPHTWQEVLELLSRAMSGDTSGANGGADNASYGNPGSTGGGDYGGGYSGGGGSFDGGGRGGSSEPFSPARNLNAPRWDGQSHGDMNLVELSESALNRALWAETSFAGVCRNGDVGCAASVSKVLQEGGYSYANSAGVNDLAGQLASNGWTESGIEGAQPGDVIYADGGGTQQHIGIVGVDENGNKVIYNNHSSDGIWHKDPWNECSIISDYSPAQVHVLHAPAGR